jgi:hypothetical protein
LNGQAKSEQSQDDRAEKRQEIVSGCDKDAIG